MNKMEIEFGKQARIELKSMAGTPFRWEITNDNGELVSDVDFHVSKSRQTPELKSVFKIKARKPGTYKVDFALSAPFVGRPISHKVFEITFK